MTFRFTLTDPIGNTKIISEPGGWDTATIGYERHPQFLSLIKYFKSSFQTYGSNGEQDGGRDWILAVEQTYGPDALIGVFVELSENDDGNFDEVYSGNIAINMFIETLDQDHLLQIAFNQPDFWAKFISRFSNQVDIRGTQTETQKATLAPGTLTPTPYFNLPLPSQIIQKKYQAVLKNNIAVNMAPPGITDGSIAFDDLLLDFDQIILDEISDTIKLNNIAINPTNRVNPIMTYPAVIPLAKFILEEDGEFVIDDFAIRMSTPKNVGPDTLNGLENRTSSTAAIVQVWIQINDLAPTILIGTDNTSLAVTYKRNDGKVITQYDDVVTDYSFAGSLGKLKANDEVRIYAHVTDTTNLVFYNNVIPPGSNIHSRVIFIWGTQGWNKDSFCPMLGGETFIPYGFTDVFVDDRFSSLITDAYDPGTDPRANAITGFPAFQDVAFTLTTIINDSYVIGVAGATIGSGIFNRAVSKGDYVQCTFGEEQAGTVTCTIGSNLLNGVGTNFSVIPIGAVIWLVSGGGTGVTRDPTRYLGQVQHINSATQIVLAANATVAYAGKAWGFDTFYVSPLSLYEGLQAYGGNRLNVTFKSQPATTDQGYEKQTRYKGANYKLSHWRGEVV